MGWLLDSNSCIRIQLLLLIPGLHLHLPALPPAILKLITEQNLFEEAVICASIA